MLLWIAYIPLHSAEEAGEGFTAEFFVEKETLGLGDTLPLRLDISYPKGYVVDEQRFQSNPFDEGELPFTAFIVRDVNIEKSSSDAYENLIVNYILEPWEPGHHFLAVGVVKFFPQTPDLKEVLLRVDSIAVFVDPLIGSGPLQAADVLPLSQKPIIDMDASNRQHILKGDLVQPEINLRLLAERVFPWHYIVLFFVALTSIFFAGYAISQYLRIRKKVPKPTPDPTKQAQKRLHALMQGLKSEASDSESFYVELTETVRQFVEDKYDINAPEKTTEEFLHHITEGDVFEEQTRQQLVELLQYADKVKFAQHASSESDRKQALKFANNFIAIS